MDEQEGKRRIDRIDRKFGIAWSRLGGAVFALLGLAVLASAFGGDRVLDRWPLLVGAAVMFGLAWLCFRSRRGLGDLLD